MRDFIQSLGDNGGYFQGDSGILLWHFRRWNPGRYPLRRIGAVLYAYRVNAGLVDAVSLANPESIFGATERAESSRRSSICVPSAGNVEVSAWREIRVEHFHHAGWLRLERKADLSLKPGEDETNVSHAEA
jgi:hypothetical protein